MARFHAPSGNLHQQMPQAERLMLHATILVLALAAALVAIAV